MAMFEILATNILLYLNANKSILILIKFEEILSCWTKSKKY